MANRDTRRIEYASKTPVYSLFQDIVHGQDVIKVYNKEDTFATLNAARVRDMATANVANEAVGK